MTPRTTFLSRTQQDQLISLLQEWGAPPFAIDNLLEHAAFGPGMVGMPFNRKDSQRGVGIMAETERDPQLAQLVRRRGELNDRDFMRTWRTGQTLTSVALSPHAPEALVAYKLELLKPLKLKRTFLFLGSSQARLLAWLQCPGTTTWLLPKDVGMQAWVKEGLVTDAEIMSHALPLGIVQGPTNNIALALEHVRFRSIAP